MVKALEKLKFDHPDIQTGFVVADFTKSSTELFFHIVFERLQNIGVLQNMSILVNNVGISNIGYVHEIPDQRLLN